MANLCVEINLILKLREKYIKLLNWLNKRNWRSNNFKWMLTWNIVTTKKFAKRSRKFYSNKVNFWQSKAISDILDRKSSACQSLTIGLMTILKSCLKTKAWDHIFKSWSKIKCEARASMFFFKSKTLNFKSKSLLYLCETSSISS